MRLEPAGADGKLQLVSWRIILDEMGNCLKSVESCGVMDVFAIALKIAINAIFLFCKVLGC